MIDLANLDSQEAAEQAQPLVLLHPVTDEELVNEDGSKWTVHVLGQDSKKVKRFRSQVHSKYRGKKDPSLTKIEHEACELLAELTEGWDGIVFEGKPLVFSRKNAVELYSKYRWIFEQVNQFSSDRSNYLGNSESASQSS